MPTSLMAMFSFTTIILFITSITNTFAKCSSDSDCAAHEGCLTSDSKCYHRFNASDFSLSEFIKFGRLNYDDTDSDGNAPNPEAEDPPDVIVFNGSSLSPLFDGDLTTFIAADGGTAVTQWSLSLSFPSDRWVKYMRLVLSEPSYDSTRDGRDTGEKGQQVEWTINGEIVDGEIVDGEYGTDIFAEIENGKYQSHTFGNSEKGKGKLPSAVHNIQIPIDCWGCCAAGTSWSETFGACGFYIHSLDILGSYHSPFIPPVSAADIAMISKQEATVSTQPCCHDYGYMVKEDAVNLRDSSSGSCERTITTKCCGNTVDYNDQYAVAYNDQYSFTQYEYRCGVEGEWHPADESQQYDEGLCDISWFNTTTADIVGTVVYGENILFDHSAFVKADDIGAVIRVIDVCQCNYTINECEGEDVAVCGSQETYDALFATDCWNNVSWKFTDDFQSEDCWKDTLQNNPQYEHLLWEPCGAQSFHGMHSEFVDVSTEHIHNGECNCTYHLPPTQPTTTIEEQDSVKCVLQMYTVVITTFFVVLFV